MNRQQRRNLEKNFGILEQRKKMPRNKQFELMFVND